MYWLIKFPVVLRKSVESLTTVYSKRKFRPIYRQQKANTVLTLILLNCFRTLHTSTISYM